MGQSNSTPADHSAESTHVPGPSQSRPQTRNESRLQVDWSRPPRTLPPSQRSSAAFLTRTQISSRNSFERGQIDQTESSEHEQVIFESEEMSLRDMGDLRMPEAPINDISAAPLPRPRSVLSRVASSIANRRSTISIAESTTSNSWTNISYNDGQSLTLPRRSSSIRHRLSRLTNFGSTSSANSGRSSNGRFSISRPIPQSNDSILSPGFGAAEALRRAPTPGSTLDRIEEDEGGIPRPMRQSRMSRFRQSISGPMDLFRNSFHGPQAQSRSSQRAMLENLADDSDFLIPPMESQDHNGNTDEPTSQHVETVDHEGNSQESMRARQDTPRPQYSNLPRARLPYTTSGESYRRSRRLTGSGRTLPNLLRGRSSRLIRRDDDTPLSRVLQLAATAIAAQLSGNTDALTSLESVGDNQLDDNLNAFVEELNNAPGAPNSARDANGPPLNFWRVFRFDNTTEERDDSSSGQTGDTRTVTLVVVGVRSVPSSILRSGSAMDGNIESLLDIPRLRASSLAASNNTDSHRAHRQRPFSSNNSFQFGENRQTLTDNLDNTSQTWSTPHSESPPGPYPPPSTPAERLSLSPASPANLLSSSNSEGSRLSLTSWIRRRSGIVSTQTSQDNNMGSNSSSEDLNARNHPPQTPVRRRRSESEAARHPHLRRDDPRRHGIIGAPRDREDANSQGRSWLIYVIGTNLAEDSPFLGLPNLFDLNGNSYEDMLRLQELIGPVKPPTATEAEILAAGGVFVVRIRKNDGILIAEAASGLESMDLPADATCIICQEKYAMQQEVRKLRKCPHIFHKDCIDTWLTQGKNSCPLCRNQGVESQSNASDTSGNTPNHARNPEVGQAI